MVSRDNAGRWYFGSHYLCRNTRGGDAYCLAVELAKQTIQEMKL